MAAVKLTIRSANGEVTLTPYLDVEAGKGMEPGAPAFTSKVWSHSLLKPGGTLALEDLQLKEQVFPVKLTAASKTALTEFVELINTVINTPGAQVEWQDEGASRPTYFDLASGQFDDEFDFRLGQNNWLKGHLRLFSQPLGYWSQKGARQVKVNAVATTTRVGTSPIVVFPASGVFDGDAPSLIQGGLIGQGWLVSKSYSAISVLPSSEYTPWLPVTSLLGSFTAASPVYSAATNAPGGTAARWSKPPNNEYMRFSATASKFAYTGEQRLLLAARVPPGGEGVAVAAFQAGGEGGFLSLSSFNIPATSTWALYDLGVVRSASPTFAHGDFYRWSVNLLGSGASSAVEVAGVVQLPESNTAWINGSNLTKNSLVSESAKWNFDGVGNSVFYGADNGVPASGVVTTAPNGVMDWSGYTRGAIPGVPVSASPPLIAMLAMNAYGASNNGKLEMALNVLERFRYAA